MKKFKVFLSLCMIVTMMFSSTMSAFAQSNITITETGDRFQVLSEVVSNHKDYIKKRIVYAVNDKTEVHVIKQFKDGSFDIDIKETNGMNSYIKVDEKGFSKSSIEELDEVQVYTITNKTISENPEMLKSSSDNSEMLRSSSDSNWTLVTSYTKNLKLDRVLTSYVAGTGTTLLVAKIATVIVGILGATISIPALIAGSVASGLVAAYVSDSVTDPYSTADIDEYVFAYDDFVFRADADFYLNDIFILSDSWNFADDF